MLVETENITQTTQILNIYISISLVLKMLINEIRKNRQKESKELKQDK